MKYYLLFTLVLFIEKGNSQTVFDTLTISLDIQNEILTPNRTCVTIDDLTNPALGTEFIDSIKVQDVVINKSNQNYYLILKDSKGTVRYEGNYYDEFPIGYVIAYNRDGSIKYEGNNELIKYNKPKIACRHGKIKLYKSIGSKRKGIWKFYDSKGYLIKRKKYL